MGWHIEKLQDDEKVHSLIYQIMEDAERAQGEEGARRTGRFLYGILSSMECLIACREGSEEPFGLSIFSPDSWEFLYVQGKDREAARSLAEYTMDEIKAQSSALYSPFPRWERLIGQDLLSPELEKLGFRKFTLVRMEAALDDRELTAYFKDDMQMPLRSMGYVPGGWKAHASRSDFCGLMIRNPSPLAGYLYSEPSAEALDWAENYVFYSPSGTEFTYPAECSIVLHQDGQLVGALLCEERGWIHQVIVDAPHHGKGLAKAMMQKTWKALAVLGATTMGLSVYRENREAYPWYQRMGLKATGEHAVWALKMPHIT